MRKVIFIAMAALALLTAQCKKNEPKPEEKVMVPITGSVDFGGSKTQITTSGYITPEEGDMIYIYDNGTKVGYMRCTPTTGQEFTCLGEIVDTSIGHECTFMYLGSNIDDGDSESISFANQTSVSVNNGKIENLNKFHVGSCKEVVTSTGEGTGSVGYLEMATKMSIAYFKLKDEGGNAIASQNVTISGVSASATIDKINGTISGDGTGSITVHTDDEGCFYMALVPQSDEVTFSFAVDGKIGSNVFPYGIRECCFYSNEGSGSPLQVAVTKAHETVNMGLPSPYDKLEWATCNLGASSPEEYGDYYAWGATETWYSAGGQTSSPTWKDGYSDGYTWAHCPHTNGTFDPYNNMKVFTKYIPEYMFEYWAGVDDPDNKLVLESSDDAATVAWGSGWRMPTTEEWKALYDNTTNAWTDNYNSTGVAGLVFTSKDGMVALFLPAAGCRFNTKLNVAGSYGYYWSSSLYSSSPNNAYHMYFKSGDVQPQKFSGRYGGYSVRPVRPAI